MEAAATLDTPQLGDQTLAKECIGAYIGRLQHAPP